MKVDISIGDLIDKITILQIKSKKLQNRNQIKNVNYELTLLLPLIKDYNVTSQMEKLQSVNSDIWDIEDKIRLKEKHNEFDGEFITIARSVYKTNDQRAAIKRDINLTFDSQIIEEKSYQKYE